MSEQGLRQKHAHFLSTLQLAHFPLVQLDGNIEAVEQNRGIGLGGVAVFFADGALELAETHAVGVGHFRLFVNLVALFECGPQALVSHDDGVHYAIGVEGKLILA